MISMSDFAERVYEVVRSIPKGQTMSYQEVAAAADSPQAFRAVASLMAKNYDRSIPCHRVVRSDGTVGEYNRGGATKKTALLKAEGAIL